MQAQRTSSTDFPRAVVLHVGDDDWRFWISTVSRVDRELFVQIVLQGPEVCTVTVHLHDGIVFGATAAEMLTRACDWLLTRAGATHGYIDMAESRASWVC